MPGPQCNRLSFSPMNTLSAGFWGCYFGTTALMLAGSVLAFSRSLHRISVNAALSALASSFFVVAFLGWLPIDDADLLARFLAHVATLCAGVLAYLLFGMMGVLKSPDLKRRAVLALGLASLAVLALGWMLTPHESLGLSAAMSTLLGLFAFLVCLRSALRGDRLAWAAVAGVGCMLIAMTGLSWIALDRAGAPWQVHAASAIAATCYLATMASVLWARYSYLIELHQVMVYGPSYDPVTRMRSHAETGQLVGQMFKSFRDQPAPLGLIVLTIANLYALEKLYGPAAVNHGLFVCAGRLRRAVPGYVEMGRLGNDGFLLLMRNCTESGRLIRLAHLVASRLARSVVLNTSKDVSRLETENTRWVAEIGVGVMIVSHPDARGSSAIAMGRRMSRTAMSYASRIAWYDYPSGEIVELPVLDPV
jgi:GGDEF domain-containing protein